MQQIIDPDQGQIGPGHKKLAAATGDADIVLLIPDLKRSPVMKNRPGVIERHTRRQKTGLGIIPALIMIGGTEHIAVILGIRPRHIVTEGESILLFGDLHGPPGLMTEGVQ